MNDSRSAVLRSLSRSVRHSALGAACLFALATIITGCTPEQDEPVLPYTHGASSAAVQLFSASPTDIRHHQRLSHTIKSHHRTPPSQPEGPAAVN